MARRRWNAKWGAWVGVGILLEAIGLGRGIPLTTVARAYVLGSALGSALAGSFIAWLGYHWLLDDYGLDLWDIVAVLTGAVVGVAGWAHRIGRG